jgi:hypothetical protein
LDARIQAERAALAIAEREAEIEAAQEAILGE